MLAARAGGVFAMLADVEGSTGGSLEGISPSDEIISEKL